GISVLNDPWTGRMDIAYHLPVKLLAFFVQKVDPCL
ncbi:unnamed protein product, partial [marine sediment metagenome]